jgi:hypothetical protein
MVITTYILLVCLRRKEFSIAIVKNTTGKGEEK